MLVMVSVDSLMYYICRESNVIVNSLIIMYKRIVFEYLFFFFIRMMKEIKEIYDFGRLSFFKYKSNKNMIIIFIQSLKYK